MEDRSPEECIRTSKQTTVWYVVTARHLDVFSLCLLRAAYAAAFFLLGGSLKDAVNVCVKKLSDIQLAIALCRIVEQGDNGPIFQELLKTVVVPLAFKGGNRWLGSWAFWKLNRRDLAVQILLVKFLERIFPSHDVHDLFIWQTPLTELASSLDVTITEVGDPHYDDPSLALLFSQLRLMTLQTAKGTSKISGRTEFNFVLQMARVLCRMGEYRHVVLFHLIIMYRLYRLSCASA